MQRILDLEEEARARMAQAASHDVELKAQIAGLQDELRQARSQISHTGTALVALEENANGE